MASERLIPRGRASMENPKIVKNNLIKIDVRIEINKFTAQAPSFPRSHDRCQQETRIINRGKIKKGRNQSSPKTHKKRGEKEERNRAN